MKIKIFLFFCTLLVSLSACQQNKGVSNCQNSIRNTSVATILPSPLGVSNCHNSTRDSVLIYKTQGLKEFLKVADYWGDDTESYWAFEQANKILDSISDYSKYEESLARIYAATSYLSYGLSYLPSVLEAGRQFHLGESNSFPKIGIQECEEIIITDYNLPPNDTLYNVSRLEFLALYSMLYFYKAINISNFEERLLHNYNRSMAYDQLYSLYDTKMAYRISSILNMQVWYNYLVTCDQIAYWENNNLPPDPNAMPWKEFTDLALWHDSLIDDIEQYENMDDKTFHSIEVTAAYTQYILLSHIAKTLGELKANRIIQKEFAKE